MAPHQLPALLSPWEPGSYWLVKLLLLKGVGTVYLIAFLVAAFQFRPLAGEEGLLPLDDYVERRKFRDSPSLFYVFPDDRVVGAAAWSGVTLSAVAVAGLPSVLGLGVAGHVAVWGALWLLYLSFVNAGQTFYGFGWETMLLETGFLTVFLGPMSMATPFVVVLLFRWLLFRNMLGAGLIKIRGDDCWRNLTCLDYHYETQPMPNPVSWFAHHLPKAVHRGGVVFNHVVELVVPFLYFAPQPVVAAAGVVTVLFQAWLMITGNFSWLNALTAVQALSTFDDATLSALVPFPLEKPAEVSTVPFGFEVAVWTLVGVVAVLSYYPVRNMISSGQRMNASFDPLHLVNTYGAFGSITKTRHEIVVQGTHDDEVTSDTDWHPYYFKGKPTETSRTPPQVAPYHLRLDWQMWFAAMSPSPRRHTWFVHLVAKLLVGDERTESLLRETPFDDPPEHIRAVRYRYEFTTPEERSETGDWWKREKTGVYYGPVSEDDIRLRRSLERLGWTETVEEMGDGEG